MDQLTDGHPNMWTMEKMKTNQILKLLAILKVGRGLTDHFLSILLLQMSQRMEHPQSGLEEG